MDGQVLREDGSVIPGLHAAGACASNIARDGKGYVSGTRPGRARSSAPRRSARGGGSAGRLDLRGLLFHRDQPPPSAAEQFELLFVVLLDGGPMADTDHDAFRQFAPQQLIQGEFQPLVERRCRLVEEYGSGSGEQDAGKRDALLLAGESTFAQSRSSSSRSRSGASATFVKVFHSKSSGTSSGEFG